MQGIPRWVIVLLSTIIFIALAWYFSQIVAYLLVAGLLSLIGRPIADKISKIKIKGRHMPEGLIALVTMSLMWLISVGIIMTFIPLIASEAKSLASIDVQQLAASLKGPTQTIENWMTKHGLTGEGMTITGYVQKKLVEVINFANVSTILNNVVGITGNLFIAYFAIAFILFFFLRDRYLFYNIILMFGPSTKEKEMKEALKSIKELLTRYIFGILIQLTIIMTVISIGLSIVGLKNAILIGFICGLFNIIPYLGPIIGASVGVLLGLASELPLEIYPMLWLSLKIMAVFFVAQMLDNFILQPYIFSNSIKAHPLEIFIVILAGSSVGGIAGMILAIPAYVVIRVVAKEFFSEFSIVQKITKNV